MNNIVKIAKAPQQRAQQKILEETEQAKKDRLDAAFSQGVTQNLNQGLDKGIGKGKEVFDSIYNAEGLAGQKALRSPDVIDVIAQRREAAKGLDAATNNAMITSAQKAGAADTMGALRTTRGLLSGAGVRGGAAGGALGSVAAAGAAKMQDQRRQFVLDNVQAKAVGLNAFEQSVLGQEGIEREALANKGKAAFAFADLGQQAAALPYTLKANEKAADAQANAAKGGASVICTELHRQGIMSDEIYAADTFYGMAVIDEQTLRGYQFLARPVARLMSRSALLTSLIAPLAMAWANNMAEGLAKSARPNRLGAFIGTVGEALCYQVGRFVPVKQEAIRVRI